MADVYKREYVEKHVKDVSVGDVYVRKEKGTDGWTPTRISWPSDSVTVDKAKRFLADLRIAIEEAEKLDSPH